MTGSKQFFFPDRDSFSFYAKGVTNASLGLSQPQLPQVLRAKRDLNRIAVPEKPGPPRECAEIQLGSQRICQYCPVMKVLAVIHVAEEGGFWAEVPALPGCVTQAESREELAANLREAIEGWFLAGEAGLADADDVLELAI